MCTNSSINIFFNLNQKFLHNYFFWQISKFVVTKMILENTFWHINFQSSPNPSPPITPTPSSQIVKTSLNGYFIQYSYTHKNTHTYIHTYTCISIYTHTLNTTQYIYIYTPTQTYAYDVSKYTNCSLLVGIIYTKLLHLISIKSFYSLTYM